MGNLIMNKRHILQIIQIKMTEKVGKCKKKYNRKDKKWKKDNGFN